MTEEDVALDHGHHAGHSHRGPNGHGESAAWTTLPAALLAVVVIGSVLAVGSVHLPVLALVAATTLAATVLTLARGVGARFSALLPWPAAVCLALAAYTLLQAVPMPIGWLRGIAPATADAWDRSLLPFGEAGPRWASLSLDPGASLVEALKWAVYAGVFAVSSTIAGLRSARWGVTTVFLAALAAALVTLGHGLAGATTVYGLYTPTFSPAAWHIGPLLNTNNLAGYLNLGVLCGLGLLLARRTTLPKWVLAPGIAAIVGIEVTSASRAGVAVLPFGIAALALLTRRREHAAGITDSPSAKLMALAIAGGALLAELGGTYAVWSELLDRDLAKIQMLLWAKPLVHDHPWFGIGRGAFESVFPLYRTAPGNIVFTHAENFPAQWISEWGLPVGIAALCAFAWAFRPRHLGVHKGSIAAGAWLGVVVVLAQNLIDLALEVPAVCIALAAVVGSQWGEAHRRARRPSELEPVASARARVAAAVAIGAAGFALVLAALRFGAHDVAADRAEVHAALADEHGRAREPAAAVRARLRQAMLRHPAEPYFALAGALVAFRGHDESPMPWLQRSLERAPVNGRAHLLLAEVLGAREAYKQALLELRLAAHDDRALTWTAATLTAQWAGSLEEIRIAVPEGKEGALLLSVVGAVLAPTKERAGLGAQCDREAILRDPSLVEPRVREAEHRIAAMKLEASALCPDRGRCRDEILEQANAIAALEPDRSTALRLRARLLAAEGKPADGARMLEQSCDRFADRVPCLSARVELAAGVKRPELLDAAAKDLLGSVCVKAAACADTASWLAGIRSGRGEVGAALALLARAVHEAPLDEARWLVLAAHASAAGAHGQALDALEAVARLRGGVDPALQKRIDAERTHAFGGLILP